MEHNHGKIGWKRWVLIAALPTMIAMLLVTGLVFLKGHIGWY
jgi:hypothetical protein